VTAVTTLCTVLTLMCAYYLIWLLQQDFRGGDARSSGGSSARGGDARGDARYAMHIITVATIDIATV
jgi:threonine/homoserine/homoserine lactone efflux protein